jgi:HSP20 family protein
MTMIKYRPHALDFDSLIEDTMKQFFQPSTGAPATGVPTAGAPAAGNRPWTPAVDIFEDENQVVLKADLPDVDQKDIEVKLENGTLTLKGERKFESQENRKGYHRLERSYGAFIRYFTLPESVNPEAVKAEYKNGVLNITLPKKEIAKPKTIQVAVS